MTEQNLPPDVAADDAASDTEGHFYPRTDRDEDDTEGHLYPRTDGNEDGTEGYVKQT